MEAWEHAIENRIKTLLARQRLGVLATQGAGQPYCSLVAFAVSGDLRHVIFATSRATRKFFNMSQEKRVAMLIDNRDNDESDFKAAQAVTVTGLAGETSKDTENRLFQSYLSRHPSLRGFVFSDDCALMRIVVEEYVFVEQFQKVERYSIIQDD